MPTNERYQYDGTTARRAKRNAARSGAGEDQRWNVDTQRKLELLSESSQYDLACACGSNDQDRRHRGGDGRWLYPVTLPQGGTSLMLKTLMSNECANDCRYCPFRSSRDVPRCGISPDEIARVFLEYQQKHDLVGLFLSSGVLGTADRTMERMVAAAQILRKRHGYRGYIHLKVIPGASDAAVDAALNVASAVSVNIEVPGERYCRQLSQRKDYERDIIRPMKRISESIGPRTPHPKVRQTTQFLVGAADETDADIVRYTDALYERLRLQRVYYSAYQRGLGDPALHGEQFQLGADLLTREHRLYQADFLLRQYGFTGHEIPFDTRGFLFLEKDPKQAWAERHPEFFPVRIGRATKEELLRVPGIGPRTARRILAQRREGAIRDLADLGLKGRRLQQVRAYAVLS